MDETIKIEDSGIITVTAKNEPYSLNFEGVECINTDAPVEERLYKKSFLKKPIYLPNQYEEAKSRYITHNDNLILSLNGYSRFSDEDCRRAGVKPGEYEAACKAIIKHLIKHINDKFNSPKIDLIYGASDLGIDKVIKEVSEEHNIISLGFSCPKYMLYVKDDEIPVYLGKNKDDYAERYVESLDLLISTGGREQTLSKDILCACRYNKRIHFVDVLNLLSSTGGVPATRIGPDGKIHVENAAAAMGRNISFFTPGKSQIMNFHGDIWDQVFQDVNSVATEVCRRKMSPERKFK